MASEVGSIPSKGDWAFDLQDDAWKGDSSGILQRGVSAGAAKTGGGVDQYHLPDRDPRGDADRPANRVGGPVAAWQEQPASAQQRGIVPLQSKRQAEAQ